MDIHTPGVYTVTGRFILPENTVLAPGLVLPVPTAPVSVWQKGKPQLNSFYLLNDAIAFPWMELDGDQEKTELYLSENGGPWVRLVEGQDYDALLGCLSVWTRIFKEGDSYRLQADYDGGQTGILSFRWKKSFEYLGYRWGDRDGGDAGGSKPDGGDTVQKPPAPSGSGTGSGGTSSDVWETDGTQADEAEAGGTQAAAAPPAAPEEPRRVKLPQQDAITTPAPQTATDGFVELFSETRDVISGTRLLLMLQSAKQARFSKQGITVTFSAKAMEGLSIKESDRITVSIEREGADTFVFSLLVNDAPVTRLEGTQVIVPYQMQAPGAALSLRGGDGAAVQGSYDAALGVASFLVDATGRFTIVELAGEAAPPAAAPAQPKARRVWPAALAMALALAAGGCFLIKRRPVK